MLKNRIEKKRRLKENVSLEDGIYVQLIKVAHQLWTLCSFLSPSRFVSFSTHPARTTKTTVLTWTGVKIKSAMGVNFIPAKMHKNQPAITPSSNRILLA